MQNIYHKLTILKKVKTFGNVLILIITLASCSASYTENLLDIYLLAREQDPIFINANLLNQKKMEQLNIARSYLLPNISIKGNKNFYNIQNQSNPMNNEKKNLHYSTNNYGLNITQPLFQLINYSQYKKTKTEVLAAFKTYEAAEQELIIRVAEKYFAVLAAIDALTTSIADYKFIAKNLQQIQQKFKVGINTAIELYEAQARLDTANTKKITEENNLKITQEQINQIIGKNINNFTPLKLELNLTKPNRQDLNSWLNKARQNNLSIQAAQYNLMAAKENVQSTYSEHLPTINLNGEISKSTNSPQDKSYNLLKQIGLYLHLPIFSGGLTVAKTNTALLDNNIAMQELELTYRNIETSTIISFNNIMNSLNNIQALESSIKSNNLAVEANQAAFAAGTRTILDVLNMQKNLLNAKKEYAKSKYNYIINTLKLKQAIGTLCLQDLTEINNLLEDHNQLMNKQEVTE